MDNGIHVHIYSLMFSGLKRDVHLKPGANIATILQDLGFPHSAESYLRVSLEGFPVQPDAWKRVYPKSGTHMTVGVSPAGDIVNDPANKPQLRQLASIGAILGGYLIPGALGLSGWGNTLLRAAITAGGVWAATTLIPLATKREVTAYQINTARNQARPYAPIPKPYGRQRVYPPLAAQPSTLLHDEQQSIRLLLVAGYKPLHVDAATLKIGETPLRNFSGVTVQIDDGWTHHDPITLFSADIDSEYMDAKVSYAREWRVDATGAYIPSNSAVEAFPAPGVVHLTTPAGTARVYLDFTFPDGIGNYEGEVLRPAQIGIEIQYRAAGLTAESEWIPVVPSGIGGDPAEQVFNREYENLSAEQCLEWLVELSALLGDLIDAAVSAEWTDRKVPQSLYETMLSAANSLSAANTNLGLTLIAGEETARTNIRTQTDRLYGLLDDVNAAIEANDAQVAEFITVFGAILNPVHATAAVLRARYHLSDGTYTNALAEFSQTLPGIFESHPTDAFAFSPQEARAGIVRKSLNFFVPDGKWDIRIRKTTPDYDDDIHLNECRLTAFRASKIQPALSDNMRAKLALVAVEVLATDQITGSLDQLSVEVETPLYYTADGSTWLGPALEAGGDNVSRNPAWAMADILTRAPNYKAVGFDRLDGANLLEFATWCTDNNFHFDHTFDQASTVHRALETVCRVAKASPTIRQGRYAVVHDKPQSIPRGFITLTNANNFESGKTMQPRPQAIRLRFKNPARDWDDDEINVYDDGFGEDGGLVYRNEVARAESATALKLHALYEDVQRIYDVGALADLDVDDYRVGTNASGTKTVITPRNPSDNFIEGGHYNVIGHTRVQFPTRIEEVDIPGLVDVPNDDTHPYHSNQVYKLGRYLLACAKLRPEVFRATLDMEHLVFERGDRVEVQMDTVLWSLGSSRILSLTRVSGGPNDGKVESITVEQDLFLEDGDTYAVRIRNRYNVSSGEATFIYDSAEPNTITFDTPFNDSTTNLRKGDLVAWGEPSKATISCLVQEIRAQRDTAAEVTLIQYAPGVYEAENGPIPEFDPRISYPPRPERQRPPAPAIIKVTTDESVLERDTDGSFASRIVLDIRLPEGTTREQREAASKVDAVHLQYRRSVYQFAVYKPEWIRVGIFPRDTTRLSIRDVEDRAMYDVRVRAVTESGLASDWATVLNVVVLGKTSPPPDVQNLRWIDDKLLWDYPNPPADHAGFMVRYASGYSGSWGDSAPAHASVLSTTSFPVPGNYEGHFGYFVKAVDTSGNESVNAAFVSRTGAVIGALFEHTRTVADFDGAAGWEETDTDVFGPEATVGSQISSPFYKGRLNSPFYSNSASDPFYDRDYPEVTAEIVAWWAGSVPGSPNGRWNPVINVQTPTPYIIEGKANGVLLWPSYDGGLGNPIWPQSMNEPYWPRYYDWEAVDPDGIPDPGGVAFPDGIRARFRLTVFASNEQFELTEFGAVYGIPVLTEEVLGFEASTTSPPETGDIVPLKTAFTHIVSVHVTLHEDAGFPNAEYVNVKKDADTVEVFVYNSSTGRVAGKMDIRVTGY